MNDLHYYSNIILHGKISDIEYSHNSHDKKYYKAILTQEDSTHIPIKFIETIYIKLKQVQDNHFEIYLGGNIRLFNKKIYVYIRPKEFDLNDDENVSYTEFQSGEVELFGAITKHDEKFNSYIINCGNNAYIPVKYNGEMEIDKEYIITGKLKQRQYSKKDTNEIFTTYEVIANEINQKIS